MFCDSFKLCYSCKPFKLRIAIHVYSYHKTQLAEIHEFLVYFLFFWKPNNPDTWSFQIFWNQEARNSLDHNFCETEDALGIKDQVGKKDSIVLFLEASVKVISKP